MEQASSMPFLLDGYDALRQGLGAMKADATAAHPVEQIQKSHNAEENTRKLQAMRQIYGSAMPARIQIESQILGSVKRLGGLPSSRLGLETMQGKLDDFSFEHFLGQPHNDPSMPIDFHSQLEKEFNVDLKRVERHI